MVNHAIFYLGIFSVIDLAMYNTIQSKTEFRQIFVLVRSCTRYDDDGDDYPRPDPAIITDPVTRDPVPALYCTVEANSTDMKHREAFLRQQRYLFIIIILVILISM